MTDPIESPEAFAERCFSSANFAERVFAADEIRARDAAVRSGVWVLVVEHLERNAEAQRSSAFAHTAEFAERVAGYFRGCALAGGSNG